MSTLLTVKDIAAKTGLRFPEVENKLKKLDVEPVEKKGLLRFYNADVIDLLEEEIE